MDFKDRTDDKVKKAEVIISQMASYELALAARTPVMQAEHAMDNRTALNFYDCLVPKIKENRRFRI